MASDRCPKCGAAWQARGPGAPRYVCQSVRDRDGKLHPSDCYAGRSCEVSEQSFYCENCGDASDLDSKGGEICAECGIYVCADCVHEDGEPWPLCDICAALGLTPFDRHLALK